MTSGNGTEQTELKLGIKYDTAAFDVSDLDSSFVIVIGKLYREVQVKHSCYARFSLKNENGLFFVKLFEECLVELSRSFEPGTELGVVGEMHSFVNRRCHNHHIYIKAAGFLR